MGLAAGAGAFFATGRKITIADYNCQSNFRPLPKFSLIGGYPAAVRTRRQYATIAPGADGRDAAALGGMGMTTKTHYEIIPYRKEDRDIYAGLEFDPNEPEPLPDAMYQEPILAEFMYLLDHYLVYGPRRRDVFVSSNTFICYDRGNLNRRIGPDCYVAVGVDAAAIRSRRLYLPWEAGKPPDLALEVASVSTAHIDTGRKRARYESIGVGEYWRFDATGGDYYGEPLVGERLVDGRYERMEVRREPDGTVWGYSPVLGLYLVWELEAAGDREAYLRLYDPATGRRLESYTEMREGREAALERAAAADDRADAADDRAAAAEEENRDLREQIRRLLGR